MYRLQASDVISAADSAREHGRIYLARELLQLAEEMLPSVDHAGTAASRLAIAGIEAQLPAFVDVDEAAARHAMLSGGTR